MSFLINDQVHQILDGTELLSSYLHRIGLSGCKVSCGEGGCGSCTVLLQEKKNQYHSTNSSSTTCNHHASTTSSTSPIAINACLRPVGSCVNQAVWTIEGHDQWRTKELLQQQVNATVSGESNCLPTSTCPSSSPQHARDPRLVLSEHGGSQCGFCSPGFVLTFAAYQQHTITQGKHMHARDIEDLFDGNLCRCTGYRSILSAFKSYSSENVIQTETTKNIPPNISDESKGYSSGAIKHPKVTVIDYELPSLDEFKNDSIIKLEPRNKPSKINGHGSQISSNHHHMVISKSGAKWIRPNSEKELIQLLLNSTKVDSDSTLPTPVKFVSGNTSSGVFKESEWKNIQTFIDLQGVQEWKYERVSKNTQGQIMLELGSATTQTQFIQLLKQIESSNPSITCLPGMIEHLTRVAGTQVRNVATLIGSCVMAIRWLFPSDIFIMLATMGCEIDVITWTREDTEVTKRRIPLMSFDSSMQGDLPALFQDTSSRQVLITGMYMILPSNDEPFHTTRVAQRLQNSHPLMNVGFKLPPSSQNGERERPRVPILLFGNLGGATESLRDSSMSLVFGYNGGIVSLKNTSERLHRLMMSTHDESTTTSRRWSSASLQTILSCASNEMNMIASSSSHSQGPITARVSLALKLFYKFLITQVSFGLDLEDGIERSLSLGHIYHDRRSKLTQGTHQYLVNASSSPVSEPLIKSTGVEQASGQTTFTQSHYPENGLHAAFIQADRATGKIMTMWNEHQMQTRIVDYIRTHFGRQYMHDQFHLITAKDIGDANLLNKGSYLYADERTAYLNGKSSTNNPTAPNLSAFQQFPIYLLAEREVTYHGQAIAILIAPDDWSVRIGADWLGKSDTTGSIGALNSNHECSNFVQYGASYPPITSVEESMARGEVMVDNSPNLVVPTSMHVTTPPRCMLKLSGDQQPKQHHGIEYISSLPNAQREINWSIYESDPALLIVNGSHKVESQYHFALETQSAVAYPMNASPSIQDLNGRPTLTAIQGAQPSANAAKTTVNTTRGIRLISSTQDAMTVKRFCEGLINHTISPSSTSKYHVTVEVPAVGGGFGSKEVQSVYAAMGASLACSRFGQPVRLVMSRDADFKMMGKRHAMLGAWKLAVRKGDGKIIALAREIHGDAGCNHDLYALSLAVMDVALLASENAYNVPAYTASVQAWFTNKASSTGMRSFGISQSHQLMEIAMEQTTHALQLYHTTHPSSIPRALISSSELRAINFYHYRTGLLPSEQEECTPYGQVVRRCNLDGIWSHLSVRANQMAEQIEQSMLSKPDERNKKGMDSKWQPGDLHISGFQKLENCLVKLNSKSRWKKYGFSALPLKFGVSFKVRMLNQGEATLEINPDGRLDIFAGGIEMGQGLEVKMRQVCASALGVRTNVCTYNSVSSANFTGAIPATAASTGSDLNGGAILEASKSLNAWLEKRLNNNERGDMESKALWKRYLELGKKWYNHAQYDVNGTTITDEIDLWPDVIRLLNQQQLLPYHTPLARYLAPSLIDLDPTTKKGSPHYYFNYAAALSLVELDILTGEHRILRADIIYDTNLSLNPAIDIGQIEGAFVQGIGFNTCEELQFNSHGLLTSTNTWSYKLPSTTEVPEEFNIMLYPLIEHIQDSITGPSKRPNGWVRYDRLNELIEDHTGGVKSSKTTGEPPFVLANTVYFALRNAVQAFQTQEMGGSNDFTKLHSPATVFRLIEAINNTATNVNNLNNHSFNNDSTMAILTGQNKTNPTSQLPPVTSSNQLNQPRSAL